MHGHEFRGIKQGCQSVLHGFMPFRPSVHTGNGYFRFQVCAVNGMKTFLRANDYDFRDFPAVGKGADAAFQHPDAVQGGQQLIKSGTPGGPGRNDDGGAAFHDSLADTMRANSLPLTLPAVRSCMSFMTCPISFLVEAPVSFITVSRMAAVSSAVSSAGMNCLRTVISASFLFRQFRASGGAELFRRVLTLLDLLADHGQFFRFFQPGSQASLGDGRVRESRLEGAQGIEGNGVFCFHGGFHPLHDLVGNRVHISIN